jgi:plasmid maintenance system antidote protein VapI
VQALVDVTKRIITDAELWLNLQNYYDLECERRAGKASEIERQVRPVGAG